MASYPHSFVCAGCKTCWIILGPRTSRGWAWAETREQPDHPNPGICVPGPRQFINNKNTTNQASTSYAEIPGGACCESKFDELYKLRCSGLPTLISGAPGGVRTPDLVLRRHTLYPSELRAHSESIGVEPLYYVLLRLTTRHREGPDQARILIRGLCDQPPRVRFFTCLASFSICSAFCTIGSDRVFVASVFSTSSFNSVASL